MDIDVLGQFIEVTRCASFSAAAKKLSMTQPGLSRNISLLERELGSALLLRSRPLTLTQTGRAVLEYANNIVQSKNKMLATVEKIRQQSDKTLRILDTWGLPSLSNVIGLACARIRDINPNIDIQFVQVRGVHMYEALQSNQLDVGFFWRLGSDTKCLEEGPPDGLEGIELEPFSDTMCVALSKNNPLVNKEHLKLIDLEQIPFAKSTDAASDDNFASFQNVCRKHGFEPQVKLFNINSPYEAFFHDVSDGAFLFHKSILDAGSIPKFALSQLGLIELEDVDMTLKLNLAFREGELEDSLALLVQNIEIALENATG